MHAVPSYNHYIMYIELNFVYSTVLVAYFNSFSHEFGFCARSGNPPERMRNSDTPHSSSARALWRSLFLLFYRQTHSSVPAFDPAETFMTCLTQSGPCCFFSFERVDERNIKAQTDTSKCRPTTSEDSWVVIMR